MTLKLIPMILTLLTLLLPSTSLAEVRYVAKSRSIEIFGPTTNEQYREVLKILSTYDSIDRVLLEGKGGLASAGKRIANEIHHRQLDVVVVGSCESACALSFLAARNGYIASGGKVLLHSPYFPFVNPMKTVYAYAQASVSVNLDLMITLLEWGYHPRLAFYINNQTSPCKYVEFESWEQAIKWKKAPTPLQTYDQCEMLGIGE